MSPSNGFRKGDRVLVGMNVDGIALNALGTVARVCRDGGAWIALDERSKVAGAHPFAADDDGRATHVKAYPEDCEPSRENAVERRKADRDAERPVPTPDNFGKDHWSLLAYIETRIVDYGGTIDRRHMRCIDARHPLYAHGHDASAHPTRLRGTAVIANHDDWDCLDDLAAAGYVENVGSSMQPVIKLTDEGTRVASLLRQHKQRGGQFAGFVLLAAVGGAA